MANNQDNPGELEVKKGSKTKPEQAGRPFERFHDWLFKSFTALVPWSVMKRVYWRRSLSLRAHIILVLSVFM